MGKIKFFLVILIEITTVVTSSSDQEMKAKKYVDDVCEKMKIMSHHATIASWNYESNITDYNRIKNNEAQEEFAEFTKSVSFKLMEYDYGTFENHTLKRLIKKMVDVGDDILNNDDFRALNDAVAKMQENYAKVKIPSYRDQNVMVQLEPEITEILTESSDPNELKYYWTQWYNLAGTPSKEYFFKYVELKNKAARLNRKFSWNLINFTYN
jgi:peptidyl-dipeptidase A